MGGVILLLPHVELVHSISKVSPKMLTKTALSIPLVKLPLPSLHQLSTIMLHLSTTKLSINQLLPILTPSQFLPTLKLFKLVHTLTHMLFPMFSELEHQSLEESQ